MSKRKIANKNDIYLFNSIHFGDIGDYDLTNKINKLHKKLIEAGFSTKFVENTTDLDRLNKEKSNKSIKNFISDSCIFLSVFSDYFYNNDDFKKHLFIAIFLYQSPIQNKIFTAQLFFSLFNFCFIIKIFNF